MNRSFRLSLYVQSWNYGRSLRCDHAEHKETRQISFSCLANEEGADFKIDDQEWRSKITVGFSVGLPFVLDPPELDLGEAHGFAMGGIHHYPTEPHLDLDEFVSANVYVSSEAFSELLLYRKDVRLIQFHAGGAGAALDFDGNPRWNSVSPGPKHLYIYNVSYNLSPARILSDTP